LHDSQSKHSFSFSLLHLLHSLSSPADFDLQ